ncbi:DNA gyrase subunit A [Candidatus Woesearchaeota archaeon]|nr:DNA gyrase subunit A [Candidatus Woesearchaeota archaeon]
MTEENTQIKKVIVEDQLKEAYLDYSMSVIVGRALPDVRDGLKPVHRRILYSMYNMGLTSNKQFAKSARIVGDCFKYHPHGDAPIYESLVRMVQDFNLRYPLIHGHGNFGCFTEDTKIKLLDGTSRSFKELCKLYKKDEIFYVYSVDKEGNIVVGKAKNPRLTKQNTKLIEITLDNGKKIRCTIDHKFLLKDLSYKEAQYLTPEDSLMPSCFKLSPIRGNTELKDYLMIKENKTEKYVFVHEIADKFNLKEKIYLISDGPVRHHIDFNKFNNNPDNLKRISWKEHTEIHNNHIKRLWQNDEFRKKQSDGVKNFYKNNPEHLERTRQILIERNKNKEFIKRSAETRKKLWQDPVKKKRLSDSIKANFERNPERRIKQSQNSKKMWSDESKRIEIINRMKEVINTPEKKEKISKRIKEYYQNHPEAKKLISERSKNLWKDENYRSNIIKKNKEKWQNPEYRKNFFSKITTRTYNTDSEYFREMGKKAWLNPKFKQLQSEKSKKQWKDDKFREKIIGSIKKSNKKRHEENPDFLKNIAKIAAESHKLNWKNPVYKNKIIKNKVLYYVNRLIPIVGEENINEITYEQHRTNNAFPKFKNAIKYFKDINEMISSGKEYNHHITNIKFLDYTENVYDITVEEHHNFLLDCGVFVHNSIDAPTMYAQMRYSEAKLHKLTEEILIDIEKETVDFIPNFDGTLKEPVVLPSKLPNLLINGSTGIAVGMTTNIPPHNISEIIEGVLFILENPNADVIELIKIIKGPDFPTGAIICGRNGIIESYKTGKGKVIVRAKTEIEDNKIIIREIPYQVNKSLLIEGIANLVKEGVIEGIKDIKDETDKTGIMVIIHIKKDENPKLILNQLYKHTGLQTTFGVIMLALVNNEPRILNLKQIIENYIEHRKEVITRRTNFDLNRAEEKAHILEGLKIALSNIDKAIEIIKKSENTENAKSNLISNFKLTEKQSTAILEMRLQRLTRLETNKINEELDKTRKLIEELKAILASQQKIIEIIINELTELKNKYGDKRRTQILEEETESFVKEELIKEQDIVVTMTYSGYIKQVQLAVYRQQKRGGKGVQGITTKEEDIVKDLIVTSNMNYLMFFTNKGRVYWLKAYEIPEASRYSKGKAIINMLNLDKEEKITTCLPVKGYSNEIYLVFATKKGVVKKTNLMEYSNIRKSGIIAINLRENDEVVDVVLTDNTSDLILTTKLGKAIRFNEKDVNEVGRNSTGVRGIRLNEKDEVISLNTADENNSLLTITEKGFGKKTKISEYPTIRRGGKGVINIKINEKNSHAVATNVVKEDDEIMIITKKGQVVREKVSEIRDVGRNTLGVHIIRLNEEDSVANIAKIEKD